MDGGPALLLNLGTVYFNVMTHLMSTPPWHTVAARIKVIPSLRRVTLCVLVFFVKVICLGWRVGLHVLIDFFRKK